MLEELVRIRPDAVFTTATLVPRGKERLPDGYVQRWHALNASGMPVLTVRDVPRPLVDVPDCVEVHGPGSAECGAPVEHYGLDQPAVVDQRAGVPDNVMLLDLTDLFCPDGFCSAVIGNVIVYHDNSHMTATYARTLAPFLNDEIHRAAGW